LYLKQKHLYIQQLSILLSHFKPFMMIIWVICPSGTLRSHSNSLCKRVASWSMHRKSQNPYRWRVFVPVLWLKLYAMHKQQALNRWLASFIHHQSPLSHFLEGMLNLSTTFIGAVIKSHHFLIYLPILKRKNRLRISYKKCTGYLGH
jgi:hypothetical protein